MTVRRKYLARASNAWRVCIYLSPGHSYEEVFYGTEAEATEREAELRAQKAAGRLVSVAKRTGPAKSGHHRLNKERIICGGRGYIVLWQSRPYEEHAPPRFKPPVVKPDLVMSLDPRNGLPTEIEKSEIIRELTSQMVRSTGKDWVIPEQIIDWGEW